MIEGVERFLMLVDRPFQKRFPLEETRLRISLEAEREKRDGLFFLAFTKRCFGKVGQCFLVVWSLERRIQRRPEAHRPPPPLSVAIMAPTASFSTSLRSGCQTSTIKTTRSSSVGFIASCSIVSSNTSASPTFQ